MKGKTLTISIYLDREQAEQLLLIYDRVRDPDITSVEDYVGEMFSKLLSRMWANLREDIMN